MTNNSAIPGWKTEMIELAHGVWAYIQAGGTYFVSNAGLIVRKDDAVVVDSLVNARMSRHFISQIGQVTEKPVKLLINTHHHSDHTWTNHLFQPAQVVCQARCREKTLEELDIDPQSYAEVFPQVSFEGARVTPQDITFEQELVIHENGRQIRLVHSGPAHTTGDAFVYLPDDGVVFCGDLLFYRCTPLAIMGYITGWIDSLELLAGLDADTYVPGHGPVTKKEGLLECHDYFIHIHDEARRRFDAGMEAFEAAKEIDLGPWTDWADVERIVANVERLYSEFRGEEPGAPLDAMVIFPRMMQPKSEWM